MRDDVEFAVVTDIEKSAQATFISTECMITFELEQDTASYSPDTDKKRIWVAQWNS
jgi:hypothetical protein